MRVSNIELTLELTHKIIGNGKNASGGRRSTQTNAGGSCRQSASSVQGHSLFLPAAQGFG
jgi:hypothetical protein